MGNRRLNRRRSLMLGWPAKLEAAGASVEVK
jgi:hypothetical protein